MFHFVKKFQRKLDQEGRIKIVNNTAEANFKIEIGIRFEKDLPIPTIRIVLNVAPECAAGWRNSVFVKKSKKSFKK